MDLAGSFESSAGNAGVRPATRTAELPACKPGQAPFERRNLREKTQEVTPAPTCGPQLAAGAVENSRPIPRGGFPAGGRGGRGAREARYVHTHLATSSQKVFYGDTQTGEAMYRKAVRRKVAASVVNSLNVGGELAEAKRLACCGEWFKLGRCSQGGQRLEPNPCNSMFCSNCAARKSKPLQKRILSRCLVRTKRYYFLTLTMPTLASLSPGQAGRFRKYFARLRRAKVWNQVMRNGTSWIGITGGLSSVECTFRPNSGGWHLHLHVLIEMPGRCTKEWLKALKAEWLRITGTGRYLNILPVYRRSRRGKKIYRGVNRKAIKELVKYVTKAADFADSPERVCEFLRAFKHVRRYQCFGSFQGALKKEERQPGDDGRELACSCGSSHYHDQFTWSCRPVHISETKAMPDGTRQLKWDWWAELGNSVEESPPNFELMRQVVESYKQGRLGFSGAMPEMSEKLPSLWAA